MPYTQFTKQREGKKVFCTRNKNTKKVVCYGSEDKRATGIRIKEAYSHGWRPTRRRPSAHIRRYKTGKRVRVNAHIHRRKGVYYSKFRPLDRTWFKPKDENVSIAPGGRVIHGDLSPEEIKSFELSPITDITDDTGKIDLDKFLIKHNIDKSKLKEKNISEQDIFGELTDVEKEDIVAETIKEMIQ